MRGKKLSTAIYDVIKAELNFWNEACSSLRQNFHISISRAYRKTFDHVEGLSVVSIRES